MACDLSLKDLTLGSHYLCVYWWNKWGDWQYHSCYRTSYIAAVKMTEPAQW